MINYILDTNIIIHLADHCSAFHECIVGKLATFPSEVEIGVSVLSLYEINYGKSLIKSYESQFSKVEQTIQEVFQIIPLPVKGAEIFGNLKATYAKLTGIQSSALKRHNIDLMLATTAIANNAILVSNDQIFKYLQHIYPDFLWEDWATK
ncbi:MAG: type II toxin-antitoxin system VapC family toxin [Magnetococcus sp. YQC-5]